MMPRIAGPSETTTHENRAWLPIHRRAVYLLLSVPFASLIVSLLFYEHHDWDLDAFLYLGSRLDHGELLYLHDFETKLPLVQYIFWVPYKLGGIGAWRIITIIVAAAISIPSSYQIARRLITMTNSPRTVSVLLISSLFLAIMYSLPGSLDAHIEILSASFMFAGIASYWLGPNRDGQTNKRIALSAVAVAIACSIRPNYLYVIPAFLVSTLLPATQFSSVRSLWLRAKDPALFLVVIAAAVTIQFLPYLGNMESIETLIEAMRSLKSQFSWETFPALLTAQLLSLETVGFFIILFSSAVIAPIACFARDVSKESGTRGLILLCTISVLGLELSFVATHYYRHNAILFAPYLCVFLAWFVDLVAVRSSPHDARIFRLFAYAALSLSCLSLLPQASKITAKVARSRADFSINNRQIDPQLLTLLGKLKSANKSFYVVNTNYHRLLNEPRIGDGHPAMLLFVLAGRRIGPIDDIFLYSDAVHASPCLSLTQSKKDVIVVYPGDSPIAACLAEDKNKKYREISPRAGQYQIFLREDIDPGILS